MKLNLGSGHILKPTEEGWKNIDKYPYPGVETMDLFRYPWNFKDNTCDEFFMSHFVEHIPHEPKPSYDERYVQFADGWKKQRWTQLEHLDDFFAFFAEIWRLGINGAKVTAICPYGLSAGAFQDPTHTRYIVPQTFAYLSKEDGVRFSYNLPFEFKIEGVVVSTTFPASTGLDKVTDPHEQNRLGEELIRTYWNFGNEITATLEVVK